MAVLLAQSYMPAQNIHVLNNLIGRQQSPWFEIGKDRRLRTPEWGFEWNELMRFK